MTRPIRYAISGLGHRSWTTYLPVFAPAERRGHLELVAVVDDDPGKLADFDARWSTRVPAYRADAFTRMLADAAPDWTILASPDYAHHAQIIEALELGASVISEKPLVISARQARDVLATSGRSRGRIRVAHNLRFQNLSAHIKALLVEERIGRVSSVEFAYHLTAGHAGSYFRRWHRRHAASGGLSITKSCHHFDLLTWWLDDLPVEVWGRTSGRHFVPGTPFPEDGGGLVPLDADIEDTIEARIRYRGGGLVSYSLTSCSPWEGYTLLIRGSRGSLAARYDKLSADDHLVTLNVRGESRTSVRVPREPGRHSGADRRMADALFGHQDAEGHGRLPAAYEAAVSVAIGDAIRKSSQLGEPVALSDVLPCSSLVVTGAHPGNGSIIVSPAGVRT